MASDLPPLDFPHLVGLPEELQCQIIANITSPSQITQLLQANPHLQQLTRNCITHILSTLTPNYGYLGFPCSLCLTIFPSSSCR